MSKAKLIIDGHTYHRDTFIYQASATYAITPHPCWDHENGPLDHGPKQQWACDAAEALWETLCRRFGVDDE